MQNITLYSWNEIIALVTSVIMGTGAYLGFIVLKKQQKVSTKFIFWVFVINLFVTYIVSELLKVMKWGEYRTLVLPLVAYAGQYFMEWFDRRYLKIFDSGLKKAGLDINKQEEEETIQDYEKNYEGEDNNMGDNS